MNVVSESILEQIAVAVGFGHLTNWSLDHASLEHRPTRVPKGLSVNN